MGSIIANMKSNLSMYLLQSALNALSTEKLRAFVEKFLDYITIKVLGSHSKVDDNLVFPIIGALRTMLSLPEDIRIDTRTLSAITAALMGLFDSDKLKEFSDFILDFLTTAIKNSETQLDDKFVLPIIRAFRVAFDIRDDLSEQNKSIYGTYCTISE